MLRNILISLLLVLAVFVYGCAAGSIHGQAVADSGSSRGSLAPDFSIKTIDGKELTLSQLSSEKPTVVYFFTTWCPNCRQDLSAVRNVYPKYSDKVNFLAIGMDPAESEAQIASYQQQMGIPEVQFAAAKRDVLAKYNVVYTTTKYFIGKDGTILNKGVGGVDAATWEQIFQSMV